LLWLASCASAWLSGRRRQSPPNKRPNCSASLADTRPSRVEIAERRVKVNVRHDRSSAARYRRGPNAFPHVGRRGGYGRR